MKIAQICTNAMSGSVGKIVRDLYVESETDGNQCMIFFGRGNNPEGYKYFKFNNTIDVYSHVFFARLFDSDGLHSKMATRRLIRKLKEFNPDVIHLHCLHGYYINYPLLFKYLRLANVKVIWTMHDCWAFTGHCSYFDFIECDKWKNECNQCKQKERYPKSIFLDQSMRNYRIKKEIFTSLNNMVVVTPSKWLCKLIDESFLKSTTRCIIPNGIDTSVFRINSKLQLKRSKMILAVASMWEDRKGFQDLIELSNMLPKDITLKIVGLNNKQKSLFSKNTIGISRTNNIEELVEVYNSATVLFNPTYEDNYPTVNLEALCCGIPIITYNTGGSVECLINDKCGYIVQKKDFNTVISLTQKISELREQSIFENTKLFSKETMINQYKKIYKNVVNK